MRYPPIQDETDLQKQVAREIAAGPRGKVKGAFVVLLHNPQLASHLQGLGAYLRFETSLPDDLRELAILVASAHWRCAYEWDAHVRITRARGLLDDALIDSLARQEMPQRLSDAQSAVYHFCLAMHRDGRVGDAEFADAVARFGRPGVLDLVAFCGYFALLAMVLNVSRHPLPEGAVANWPQ